MCSFTMQAFEPLSVQLSRLPQTSGSTHTDSHTLAIKVLHEHQHQLSQLGVLAMTVTGKNISAPATAAP